MSSSKVSIYNNAGISVGSTQTVSSPDERSKLALLCTTVYDPCVDFLFRRFEWSFATKVISLQPTSETPPTNWSYEYAYPNDCVRFVGIVNSSSRNDKRPPHKKGMNSKNQVVLWTDQEQAEAEYVSKVIDPNLYDGAFIECLTALISYKIAFAMTGSAQIQGMKAQEFNSALVTAGVLDIEESSVEDSPDPDFIKARN